ncbi:diguanylate cyclase domain-containing protein [Haloimpatiens massiliensis]|uniref:diguanylate cyclase domain-containing protein n=1 Tax=Haloimpatiens massiliensis TaxID=1658110 RepID=UPI000C857C38|nr:diguanylate cyclase [Haloimpatiens massiliensis]
MDKILYDTLNDINEAIILLDENFNIALWNSYMEHVTGITKEAALYHNIYDFLPNLDKNYFRKSLKQVLNDGYKMFFSAAMHKEIIINGHYLNLKISRLQTDYSKLLLLEFTNVTNQFIRINQLKNYINQLSSLNKKLKYKEVQIKKLAYYDKLTNVPNRTLFYKIVEKFLINADRTKSLLALMFVDVDNFKFINDTYGHKSGDNILISVANSLNNCTRKGDIVARFGGDEFLILLPNIKNPNDYKVIVSRILNERNKPIYCNGEKIKVSLSIGVSLYPFDGKSLDELISNADKSMYIVKNNGGNNFTLYNHNMCEFTLLML